MKNTVLYIVLLFFPAWLWSQGSLGYLFEEMPLDSFAPKTVQTHTSVKPLIRQESPVENSINLLGLADLNGQYTSTLSYKTGLGLGLRGQFNKKWDFHLMAVQGISTFDSIFAPKAYVATDNGTKQLYTDIRSRISYTPNHIFNFQIGLDNNFIGQGSRSLFLSDYGKPYPFGLIRANFWRLEYSILYQFMREKKINSWDNKFMSSHHISFNATKWLHFGIFESVIFQPTDTNLVRGFDAEYLNPVIFYRPQEYSLGSSDNVLLGIELSADWKTHTFYSQFILDEFYLDELRKRNGWWANKFGGQLGVKGRFKIGKEHFFYRTEYNFVRPYTFSHTSDKLNYGNQGSSITHPYGANFMEILGELKWENKQWTTKLFVNYFLKGNDKDGYSYGGNIYQPYTLRPYEYGHFIGQGIQQNGLNAILSASYKITKHGNLQLFIENHFRYSIPGENTFILVSGIRSMLWNDYRNY